MRLLYGHSAAVARFVADRFPPEFARGFEPCVAIGVIDNDGRLVAGVVYNNWFPERGVIEMTAASLASGWLAPRFVAAFLAYPFDQCGCDVIVAQTMAGHREVRRWAKACGARGATVPNLGGLGVPLDVFTLARPDWERSRIFRRLHGFEPESAAAA